MAHCAAPLYEPVPDYMRKLLLLGARFVTGNTGEGSEGSTGTAGETPAGSEPASEESTTEEATTEVEAEEEAEEDSDDFKSEESKEAVLADLKKERDRRKKLQADHEAQVEDLNSTISENETTVAEREAQLAQKDAEIHVLKLAITHGISNETDLKLLTAVEDKEARDSLAERLGKAADKNFIISESGTGNGDVGGTVAAGRDLYNERRKK